ncbi:hypothetical protein EW145_g3658 [Phellinidium pouzarii]|uniref:RNase III domain-containing protein n=1 Tax=Phellinidium pouzarii TaxID=167371 RepID=A0A4S4L885_9AGAM|nr:hypothetical protein EW145_g3658 [Phellinidium pouzarii]
MSRRFEATAAARRPASDYPRTEYLDDDEWSAHGERNGRSNGDRSAKVPYPKERPRANPEPLIEHLHHIFPPLEFPPTISTQMLTHISAKEAWAGHNARLAFVASVELSPASSPSLDPDATFDFNLIAYRALHTNLLGEYVGNQWKLRRIMLWTLPIPSSAKAATRMSLSRHFEEDGKRSRDYNPVAGPGLYKVQGTTVEGIMGGVFHQFGGTIAQRVFHTRLLPHILCPGTPFGLHDAFHNAALDMQERMGGADGLLVKRADARLRQSSTPSSGSSHSYVSEGFRETKGLSRPSTESEQLNRKRILS